MVNAETFTQLIQSESLAQPLRHDHFVNIIFTHIRYIILFLAQMCPSKVLDIILLIPTIQRVGVDKDRTAS